MEFLKTEDLMVRSLDSIRVNFLRLTLRLHFLRKLYSQTHSRLATGMILSTIVYLPIAFFRPDLLLAFGPLIFGYFHLVASYRFTSYLKTYGVFVAVTLVAVALHLTDPGLTPFGVWQIVVATMTFILTGLVSKTIHLKQIGIAIIVCGVMISLAWAEPIMYVGGTLILHNWIAFIYWIKNSTTNKRKLTAFISTVLFFVIHVLVFSGTLDFLIPMQDGIVTFKDSTQTTGWYLASWTNDSIVWYRLLVLYTFGLSIHYFVWLRAIPESMSSFEHPNSVRVIVKNLRNDLGKKALLFTALAILGGVLIWLLSFPTGNRIYFEVAILHGALEIMYLQNPIITRR